MIKAEAENIGNYTYLRKTGIKPESIKYHRPYPWKPCHKSWFWFMREFNSPLGNRSDNGWLVTNIANPPPRGDSSQCSDLFSLSLKSGQARI